MCANTFFEVSWMQFAIALIVLAVLFILIMRREDNAESIFVEWTD